MTQQQGKPHVADGKDVGEDADILESKFGDLAKTYAENRSEAAELRGADDAAAHWRRVESEIEEGNTDS